MDDEVENLYNQMMHLLAQSYRDQTQDIIPSLQAITTETFH